MAGKPTYEELEQRVKELEKETLGLRKDERDLKIFKTAVESSINAIGITDLEGKLIYVNDSCVKMWGHNSKDDILGRFLPEFWEGDGVIKTIKELLEKGVASGEDVGKRKDGSLFYVQFTASMFKDEAGNPSFMFGSFFDITERRQVEMALRESEEKYRHLSEGTFEAVVWHYKGKIIEANEQFYEMFGYKPEELAEKDAILLIATPDSVKFMRGQVSLGHLGPYEVVGMKKDGTEFPMEIRAKMMKYKGQTAGMAAIRDLTDPKRAEEALRVSEERFRSLIDNVIDSLDAGLFILDSDFIVVWVNQALELYFGLKREEVVGKNKRQLIQEQIKYNLEDPEGFAERVLATYDNNTYVENFECHVLSGNKRKDRWLEHWSRPIRSGLYSGGRIELYYNITDQRHAEEALQKAHDELERRVEERTEELKIKTKSLEEINTAMKVLLKKREEDKIELQDNILSNVKTLIEPYVNKLKNSSLPQGQQTLINILESNLNEIVSPFTRKLSSKLLNLSPSEIQVANLVKYGKTNKEIAEMLHVAKRTIAFHRENIRKKLGIKNQKTNLKTYLMSLD